jgi:hypothetical protein
LLDAADAYSEHDAHQNIKQSTAHNNKILDALLWQKSPEMGSTHAKIIITYSK